MNKNKWIRLIQTCASPSGVNYLGEYMKLPEARAQEMVDLKAGIYEDPAADIFPSGEFQGKSLLYVLRTFGKSKLQMAVDWIRDNSPDKNFLKRAEEFITDKENAGKCRCPECGNYHKNRST
jgi:hypothetical protein